MIFFLTLVLVEARETEIKQNISYDDLEFYNPISRCNQVRCSQDFIVITLSMYSSSPLLALGLFIVQSNAFSYIGASCK